MSPIRILIADDVEVFREGLRALLSAASDVQVAGEAEDGYSAVELAQRVRPDVALVDMRMPGLDGVEVTRRLRIFVPSCHIVALTTFDDDDLLFGALRAGASGYLLKDLSAPRLLEAIHAAHAGQSVLAPRVVGKVVQEFARLPGRKAPETIELSPREREVLHLLMRGATNKEIANALHIALGTVKNHLTSLYGKLGAEHRVQAALRARELGLL